jgi:hypothetical protein
LIPKLAPLKSELEQKEYRDAYAAAKDELKLTAFIEQYATSDPDKLVPEARKQLSAIQRQNQIFVQATIKKANEDAAKAKVTAQQAAAQQDANRLKYIRDLHVKYAGRIVADSPEGGQIVANYKIDCKSNDRRVLPLMHALYASIAELDRSGVAMRFQIQNRGKAVRIISHVSKDGKQLGDSQLYYEINEWGDLHAVAVRNEAVLNACYGFQGKIWLMPGEPGY